MSTPSKKSLRGGGSSQGDSDVTFKNQVSRIDDLPDPSELPIERLQDVEKQLQRKMRAMQEAGVPVLVAAATANHIVQDLLKEALSGRDSGKGAPMH